jgi:hypothetical protein
MMANLASQVGTQLLPVITPVLQQLAQGAATVLPQVVAQFQQFGANMSTVVGPAMLMIENAWNRIVVAFGGTAEPLNATQMLLQGLGFVLDALVIGVQAFAIAMQGIAFAVERVSLAIAIGRGLWQQFLMMMEASGVLNIVGAAIDLIAAGLAQMAAGAQAILPALGALIEIWQQLLTVFAAGVFEPAINAINALQSGLAGLQNIINSVIGAWQSMAGAFQNIQIPDVLTPGSPTPMETGLRGISDALQAVSRAMPANLGANQPAPGPSGVGGMAGNVIVNLDGREIFNLNGLDARKKMGAPSPL